MPACPLRLFHHPTFRLVLLRSRILLGLALAAALVYFARPDWFWPALAVALAGELGQVWANSCLEKNKVFQPRGPYTLVRNPMYVGRFLVILGVIAVTARWYLLVAYVLLYAAYVTGRVAREEKTLEGIFGEPYRAYLAAVPRFFPLTRRPYRVHGPVRAFRWGLVLRNREHYRLIGLLVFFALAWFRITHR